MIYLLCGLLGGGVLTAICVPLFRKEQTLESAIIEETEWDLLMRKKEVLLGNIQDLDFEYKCGKLSEADYKQVRKEMTGEVAAVLERIHDHRGVARSGCSDPPRITARKDPSTKRHSHACPSCGSNNPTQKQILCGMRRKNKS